MRSLMINLVCYALTSVFLIGLGIIVYGTLNRLFHKPFFSDMKGRMLFWSIFVVGGFLLDQPLRHLFRTVGTIK